MTPTQLKREIKRIDCGQTGLAERLGVSRAEVRQWLAGKGKPMPVVVASDIRRMPAHAPAPPRQG
jgi:DNA-binding transcriptional regulator YdaS (Cro superfamily)